MKTLIFLVGAIGGATISAGVHQCHIVQTGDQWLIVPRVGVTLKDVYADVRNWTIEDWRAHPELARDMVKAGHAEVLQPESRQRLSDATDDEEFDRITQRPESPMSTEKWPSHSDTPRHKAHDPALRRHDDFEPESLPE